MHDQKLIDIDTLRQQQSRCVVLDVRSPSEYNHAHIPGALNLPLFTDEERAIVGTLYKQVSPEKALLEGLGIAGGKMKFLVEQALLMAPEKKVIVHCWRGGKRSQSMAWLLGMAGFEVSVLAGGYKYYRQSVLKSFDSLTSKLIVIGGQTGIGKTYVLHQLQILGEQIIDLEYLAHHKGSAFGSLGEKPQPSTEYFENKLCETLLKLDHSRRIFIENESILIGTCRIPQSFFHHMKTYSYIQYSIPIEDRIDRLIQNYACYPKNELAERFQRIKTKLGGDFLNKALAALDENNFAEAATIALRFYDKTYQYGFEKNITPNKYIIGFDHADTALIAKEIVSMCDTLQL
jgi:tRNA 2-selenouridine synthase